ncbi:MAG: glycoside hydrolase family 2 TIM barrel-domain containing protein [Sphaerochaetaceae bacterium]
MFKPEFLEDTKYFNVGTLPPYSDHKTQYKKTSLNGQWDIVVYNNPSEVPQKVWDGDVKDLSFGSIKVPSHLQIEGFDEPQYVNQQYPWEGKEDIKPPMIPKVDNKVAVYKKDINLTSDDLKQRVHIVFEGAESCMALYVNGQYVGYREDSFTPNMFDIKSCLKEGHNEIVAIVVHYCKGSWFEDQDFWRFSGLFRPVYLVFPPEKYIESIEVDYKLFGNSADMDVNVKANGILVCPSLSFSLEGDGVDYKGLPNAFRVDNLKLWSCESPTLYTLAVNLFDEDVLMDSVTTKIGFREIKIEGNQVLLNGKRLIFHGVNRHEFSAINGRAMTEQEIRSDLELLKKNNVNAVRTSHYPNQSCFYEMCDELGLYVIDEMNLETHGTWQFLKEEDRHTKAIPGNREEYTDLLLDRAAAMVVRDRLHPSVLFWSCGNESWDGDVIRHISDYFSATDPSRLVHYESVFITSEYWDVSDVESQMYTKPADCAKFMEEHPERPFMLCEYNHAMGNSCGGLHIYTELEDKYEAYLGGFIWDFRDQNLKEGDFVYSGTHYKFPTDDDFCSNGILLADSDRSSKMMEIKHEFSPVKIYVESDKSRVRVENRRSYTATDDAQFSISYMEDGAVFEVVKLDLSIEAGSVGFFDIKGSDDFKTKSGEIVVKVSYGDIFTTTCVIRDAIKKDTKKKISNVIEGIMGHGVPLSDAIVMSRKIDGLPNAILVDQKNIIARKIQLETWRAPVSNDYPNFNIARWMSYKLSSMYSYCDKYTAEDGKILNHIKFGPYETDAVQTFYDDNSFDIEIDPPKFPSDLPCFGITFGLSDEFDTVHYYGNTIRESYSDRKESCVLGIATRKVKDCYIPYVNPQENGNLTDLRYLEILNAEGHGLRITCNSNFEGSVLPYNPHELEDAKHPEDLGHHNYNTVRILHGNCGVGGDDSWGAPVHEEFLYWGPKEKMIINIKVI